MQFYVALSGRNQSMSCYKFDIGKHHHHLHCLLCFCVSLGSSVMMFSYFADHRYSWHFASSFFLAWVLALRKNFLMFLIWPHCQNLPAPPHPGCVNLCHFQDHSVFCCLQWISFSVHCSLIHCQWCLPWSHAFSFGILWV